MRVMRISQELGVPWASRLDPGRRAAAPVRGPVPGARRDAALLALLLGAGLRRSEATALELEDCDLESGRAALHSIAS